VNTEYNGHHEVFLYIGLGQAPGRVLRFVYIVRIALRCVALLCRVKRNHVGLSNGSITNDLE